jgi:hypothetical protein
MVHLRGITSALGIGYIRGVSLRRQVLVTGACVSLPSEARMKTILLIGLSLALALPAQAKKIHSDSEYQDGILVTFRTIVTGSSCNSSGVLAGSVDESGSVKGNTQSNGNCSNRTTQIFTVQIGENKFEIKPLPVSWNRVHALEHKLPGYKFKVRQEKGKLFIKIDARETGFEIREAS